MRRLKKSGSKLLAIILATLSSSCVSTPNAPDVDICTYDRPRKQSICFTAVTSVGPTKVPEDEMDHWTTMPPDSKASMDDYIQALKRRIDWLVRENAACKKRAERAQAWR